jgi:rRNA small subunit pseudouridine methyltransferase Nep1
MPLIMILVECGIELIPKEIRDHSSIKKNFSTQLYSSQLLDNALHHSAMKSLRNFEKRGRPDITHLSLLNVLGSPLNKSGNIRLFLHTINNKIFEFNPEIRISRNYNRFKGLLAKLLIDKDITVNGTQLITSINGNIQNLISKFSNPKIFIFSKRGKLVNNYSEIFDEDIKENIIAIIGGFQKGSLSYELMGLSENIVSISKYSLDAWVVVSKVINNYEIIHNIF